MKRVYFIVLFFLFGNLAYSAPDPWADKVLCAGGSVILGEDGDPKACYSWKSSPADPGMPATNTDKITVSPTKTTTYTRTEIGDEFVSVTTKSVKVIVVDPATYTFNFQPNPGHPFGYDEISGSTDIYLSMDKNGVAKVNVKASKFTANAFCVTSSDPAKAKVANDSVLISALVTPIEITGNNSGGDHESILLEVRCGNKSGTVITTLHVELYKKLDIAKISYYRIKDGTVAATTPKKNPTFSSLKTELNKHYTQAVIEVLDVDGDKEKDLRYDLNNNGFLDFYNDGANPEKDVIEAAGLTGSPKIAYVEKMRDNWRLSAAAAIGDNTLKLVTVSGLATSTYRVGSATGAPEIITVTAINVATNTLTLSAPLTKVHPVTHTLYGGLAGLSSNPQLITDAGGELIVTIVHEILHSAVFGNLHDLSETDNVMYWTTGGLAGVRKLRYRDQIVVDTGTGVPTGAKQMQWDTIIR